MEIIFDKKKTFIRKSLNYLPFIIMIAKCQTPGVRSSGTPTCGNGKAMPKSPLISGM